MESSPVAVAALTAALAVIMACLGTTLRGADFRALVERPRAVAVGLANLLVGAPLLALLVARLTGLDPVLAAGLVLLGAAPGGVLANLLTHLAGGTTALSVTMTAISSIAAVVTVPLWLGIGLRTFDAPVASGGFDDPAVVLRLVLGVTVPLILGMVVAAAAPAFIDANTRRIEILAVATFAVVVVAAVASQAAVVIENLAEVAVAALLLNVLAMAAGFGVSRLARLEQRQATAIALELGVHNAAVAVAIGSAVDERLAIPAAVYSAFMVGTAGIFAALMARRNRAAAF